MHREILRFAQKGSKNRVFLSLFGLSAFVQARTKTRRLKPALQNLKRLQAHLIRPQRQRQDSRDRGKQ
jgi:hypothetical protein